MIGWDNVISTVKSVSPLLASAISSKNPVGGIALNLISQAFGANKNDPEDIINKINADPEYQLKLRKIEFEHEEALSKSELQIYKTETDDRKNARDRETTLHDWVPTFLAIGFLLNYAAIQFYCVMHGNTENDIISARFQDVLIMIMSYYFGSIHKKLN
jgi:hypothetical protein